MNTETVQSPRSAWSTFAHEVREFRISVVRNEVARAHSTPMPQRYQRSRHKGARLPQGVVVVTRPTKWGNPHPLSLGRAEAIRRYHDDLLAGRLPVTVDDVKRELRGRDLACYCGPDVACHADVLLAIANE
jgi:hypothetical protein